MSPKFARLIGILLLFIGIYIVPLSVTGTRMEFFPGGMGEPVLTSCLLEHGFLWLSGKQKSFWDAPFFYPAPNMMAYSDNHLGNLPIYSVFRALKYDRETALQLWFITLFILNYIACVWVLEKFSVSIVGAAAGAFIFTFSMPVIEQLGYAELLPLFMVQLSFYFAWNYLNKQDIKSLIGLCLSVVWQFYCTIYIGFFLILALIAFLLSCAVIRPKHIIWGKILWGSKSELLSKAAIILCSGLILLPLFLPYMKVANKHGLRSWDAISRTLPRIQSLLIPTSGSLLWDWLTPLSESLPRPSAHRMFVGGLPWISLLALFFIRQKRKNVLTEIGIVAALSALFIILLTLSFKGFSIYKWVSAIIPGLRAIRAVTRISLVLSFFFAITTGVLFTSIENYLNGKVPPILIASALVLLLGILVADQSVRISAGAPKSEMQKRFREVADNVLKQNPKARVFAYMPPKSDQDSPHFVTVHTIAMSASQIINIPTVNGFSGSNPGGYYDFCFDYNQCWALQKWITFSTREFSRSPSPYQDGKLFDGLVVVGSPQGGCSNLVSLNKPITITYDSLPEKGFHAKIEPGKAAITLKPNEKMTLPVNVTNISDVVWPSLGDGIRYRISLTYRILSADGEQIKGYESRYPRFPLHYDVLPGEVISLDAEIKSPEEPGDYILEFDMIQDFAVSFREKGSKTADVILRVEK